MNQDILMESIIEPQVELVIQEEDEFFTGFLENMFPETLLNGNEEVASCYLCSNNYYLQTEHYQQHTNNTRLSFFNKFLLEDLVQVIDVFSNNSLPFCGDCVRKIEHLQQLHAQLEVIQQEFIRCKNEFVLECLDVAIGGGVGVSTKPGFENEESNESDRGYSLGCDDVQTDPGHPNTATGGNNISTLNTLEESSSVPVKFECHVQLERLDLKALNITIPKPKYSKSFMKKIRKYGSSTGTSNLTKPFQCNICLKTFTRTSYLRTHQNIHSGLKPFKCDLCDKSFRTRTQLQLHVNVHTQEKNHVCDLCSKGFGRRELLRAHLIKFHKLVLQSLRCPHCTTNRRFWTNEELNKHVGICQLGRAVLLNNSLT